LNYKKADAAAGYRLQIFINFTAQPEKAETAIATCPEFVVTCGLQLWSAWAD